MHAIGIATRIASEVFRAHYVISLDASLPSYGSNFKTTLDDIVQIASSSMIQEGLVSFVQTSCRDTSMIKFCWLTILGLSKKFEEFELKLAEANKARLATKGIAINALPECEAMTTQKIKGPSHY